MALFFPLSFPVCFFTYIFFSVPPTLSSLICFFLLLLSFLFFSTIFSPLLLFFSFSSFFLSSPLFSPSSHFGFCSLFRFFHPIISFFSSFLSFSDFLTVLSPSPPPPSFFFFFYYNSMHVYFLPNVFLKSKQSVRECPLTEACILFFSYFIHAKERQNNMISRHSRADEHLEKGKTKKQKN